MFETMFLTRVKNASSGLPNGTLEQKKIVVVNVERQIIF